MTFNIGILAWFSSVPFLLYLHRTRGFRSRLYFALALILAWSLCVFKITTDPLPLAMVPMFSVPIALIQLPGYLLWAKFRNRDLSCSPFPGCDGCDGMGAIYLHSTWQLGCSSLLPGGSIVDFTVVSIFGMAGLGFVIYHANSVVAEIIIDRNGNCKKAYSCINSARRDPGLWGTQARYL